MQNMKLSQEVFFHKKILKKYGTMIKIPLTRLHRVTLYPYIYAAV